MKWSRVAYRRIMSILAVDNPVLRQLRVRVIKSVQNEKSSLSFRSLDLYAVVELKEPRTNPAPVLSRYLCLHKDAYFPRQASDVYSTCRQHL